MSMLPRVALSAAAAIGAALVADLVALFIAFAAAAATWRVLRR